MGNYKNVINTVDDIAMNGFDVVAYFNCDAAVKGSTEFTHSYKEVIWQFSNEEHRQAFIDNPTAYEPQYNSWCASAVSSGYGAEVDFIRGWSVRDGKLI